MKQQSSRLLLCWSLLRRRPAVFHLAQPHVVPTRQTDFCMLRLPWGGRGCQGDQQLVWWQRQAGFRVRLQATLNLNPKPGWCDGRDRQGV